MKSSARKNCEWPAKCENCECFSHQFLVMQYEFSPKPMKTFDDMKINCYQIYLHVVMVLILFANHIIINILVPQILETELLPGIILIILTIQCFMVNFHQMEVYHETLNG